MTISSLLADLRQGDRLPLLEVEIDSGHLVRYCGASGDYNRQHWDQDHMRAAGFPGVIVHGWLTFAHMCRAVTRVVPREAADIASYAVRYHAPASPGLLRFGGEVVAVRTGQPEGDEADLQIWATDEAGAKLASATMTLRQTEGRKRSDD